MDSCIWKKENWEKFFHKELYKDGITLSGRPSVQELFKKLNEHRRKIKSIGVKAKLGDLKGIYLEMEFEERILKY